jgi:hypothetical protein
MCCEFILCLRFDRENIVSLAKFNARMLSRLMTSDLAMLGQLSALLCQ